MRNPWRFSFDRQNGDLYIGDVGQNCYEEINYQPPISSGLNYGWRLYEGFHQFNPADQSNCNQPISTLITLTKPITEYNHSFGCAVIGGYVYRGPTYPTMQGVYFFSDECSGRVWGAQFTGSVWATIEFTNTPYSPSSFGEDQAGELYIVDYGGGVIYRVKTP